MQANTMPSVDAAAYAALVEGAAVVVRPDAGVLRLDDADRSDFLHRMTTANINALHPGQSAVTVLTSPTARILFVFTVVCRDDHLLLLPAPGQSAALARHLRSQIFFMDKVKVTDASEAWARLRVVGPQAGPALDSLGFTADALAASAVLAQAGLLAVVQPHFDLPGIELLVPAARQTEVVDALQAAGVQVPADLEAYAARRIELGRPAAGHELTDEYNPLEAGLAWACAENKGCYTGQEIIARQISYDKVTRTLVGLRAEQPLTPGADVIVDGRSMGQVTSAAYSPALRAPLALAVVKRPANNPGTLAVADGIAVKIAALPFVADAQPW